MELIQWQTAKLFHEFFRDRAADQAASAAVRGLLYEVSTTPKPGLVDRNNLRLPQRYGLFYIP